MGKEVSNTGIAHNVLAYGTKIKGEITAESDFRIDGTVDGNLDCKGKVVIGPQGVLKGHLVCQNAEIMGHIEGTVVVGELLSLKETARVFGEIKTKTLMIEQNAIFTGSCDMGKPAATTENKK